MKPADLKWKLSVIRARWDGLRSRCAGKTARRFLLYPAAWPFIRSGFPETPAEIVPGSYLTYRPNRVAGIGHQTAAWITAFNLSRTLGLRFVHRPLSADWDDFLGFGSGEMPFSSPEIRRLHAVPLPLFPGNVTMDLAHPVAHIIANEARKRPCLFYTEYDQTACDLTPVGLSLGRKFFSRHPDYVPTAFQHRPVSISFHIRRGDILGLKDERSDVKYQRFLPESYYVAMATAIKHVFGNRAFRIHVLSDGKPEDFSELRVVAGLEWHGGLDAQSTFRLLAASDLLVMGRSGFSFLAGLINSGFKVATVPWWHNIPKTSKWSTVSIDPWDESGLFERCVNALQVREEGLMEPQE